MLKEYHDYHLPSIDNLHETNTSKFDGKRILDIANLLTATLSSFGFPCNLTQIQFGPAVSRIEVQMPNTSLNQITGRISDIGFHLGIEPSKIRVYSIPGDSIAFEVPNKEEKASPISLREMMEMVTDNHKLLFPLGKTFNNIGQLCSLEEFTSLFIASNTESELTNFIHSSITSLLFEAKPDDLKLILVDSNKSLTPFFSDVPHLWCPIIENANSALSVLQWAGYESVRRYNLIKESGASDLTSFNESIKSNSLHHQKIPQLLIVINELADLMETSLKDEIEDTISRIAQNSRTVGIHLLLAAKNPSASVFTAQIKASIPTRIAFYLPSTMDSRVVLDSPGAEKLIGGGDMLFLKGPYEKPIRIQGCAVTEQEIMNVTTFIALCAYILGKRE